MVFTSSKNYVGRKPLIICKTKFMDKHNPDSPAITTQGSARC